MILDIISHHFSQCFTTIEPLILLYDNRREGARTQPLSNVLREVIATTHAPNVTDDTRYHKLISVLFSQHCSLAPIISKALATVTPKTLTNITAPKDVDSPLITALVAFFEATITAPDSKFPTEGYEEHHTSILECEDGELAWSILEHTHYPFFNKTHHKKSVLAANVWRTIVLVNEQWSQVLIKHKARMQIYNFWYDNIHQLFAEPLKADDGVIYNGHSPWFKLPKPDGVGEMDEMNEMEITACAVQLTAKEELDEKTGKAIQKFLNILKELDSVAIPDVDTMEPRLLPGMEDVAKEFLYVSKHHHFVPFMQLKVFLEYSCLLTRIFVQKKFTREKLSTLQQVSQGVKRKSSVMRSMKDLLGIAFLK